MDVIRKCIQGFYCATIAYHVELNAYSGGRRHLAYIQEKWMHNSGEIPWNQGDPSGDVAFPFFFRVGREYRINAFLSQGKKFNFIWIYVLLETETTSVSLFYNIESNFMTIHISDEYLTPAGGRGPWSGDYKTPSVRECIRPSICSSCFCINLNISFIYKDIFTRFAGNVYGYANLSLQNFNLIWKNKMAAIANCLKIIKVL